MPEQLTFGGGLNAMAPVDKLAPDEVSFAENIDFGLEPGALRVRRGSVVQGTVGVGGIRSLNKYYNAALSNAPTYAVIGQTVYRSTDGTTFSSIITDFDAALTPIGFSTFRNHAYIANGTSKNKDDGTSTIEWAKQFPTAAPTVTSATQAPLVVTTTWSVAEGTGSPTAGTATATADEISLRVQFDAVTMLNTNLNTNGGIVVGDFGIDYLNISSSEPKLVTRISRDYSIGDANFTNYWHTELDVTDGLDALPVIEDLIDAQLNIAATTNTAVSLPVRARMRSEANQSSPRPPRQRLSMAKNQFNVWAVPRTKFERIGPDTSAGWANIQAARVVVEALGPIVIKITSWDIRGSEGYPLNDSEIGYAWWETYAAYDSSNRLLWESAPSPSSARTRMQAARAAVVMLNTATGTLHGFTHKHLYRQGGFLPAPYRVGTYTGTASNTFTDSKTDIQALSENEQMVTNLRFGLPNNIVTISEPFHNRVFIGYENHVGWSMPGNPDQFPADSDIVVSHVGDQVKQIIVYPSSLVVVNRDSVFEMIGTEFEEPDANFILQRSGSRHGASANKTIIKTDFGIPLLNQDGLYMYIPGQGIDVPVDWFMEKMGHIFMGAGTADPAYLAGQRVPAIYHSYIGNSVAAFKEGKLYLGCPTGTNTQPNTVYVLDFKTKHCWYYTYPWTFQSMFWDWVDNRMLLGGSDGYLYRTDIGVNDSIGPSTVTSVPHKWRSRAWTAPTDTVMENLMVDYVGTGATVRAIYDSTNTATVGTFTSVSNREWLIPKLSGTFARQVEFHGTGTQADNIVSVYGIGFDALQHPARVQFYRTPHNENNHNGDKIWDVHYADIEIIGTGTVLGTVFVDNAVTMTATIVGPPNDRQIATTAFPPETYGRIAYTIYNSVTTTRFKHWETRFDARNEPPRVNSYVADRVSLEENICDAFDTDINPNGTTFGTVFVDNIAVTTGTFIGTKRQSYTTTITAETYGRTIYVQYSGTAFKHYNTWYHQRLEPDRWYSFVTDRESMDEAICDGFDSDVNPLGTMFGTCYVDGTVVTTATLVGNRRQSYTTTIPVETYGRTVWVVYNGFAGEVFKHYKTWFHKRPEPDRWTSFVSDREVTEEKWFHNALSDLNCLGNTVLGTCYVNTVAVATFTYTGNGRQDYSRAMPSETYGNEFHIRYTCAAGTFKHYKTWNQSTPEPERVTFYESKYDDPPSNSIIKTWVPELNPLGTCTGTLFVDGIGVSTATFTGTLRNMFEVGLTNVTTGKTLKAQYSGTLLKHYQTNYEMEPKPFTKKTWVMTYKKPGGATQLDMARFYDLDIEPVGTATVTCTWKFDGSTFQTDTYTFTARAYKDRIPFGPGGRLYLAQHEMTSLQDFRVWRSNMEIERIGVKGLSKFTVVGRPVE